MRPYPCLSDWYPKLALQCYFFAKNGIVFPSEVVALNIANVRKAIMNPLWTFSRVRNRVLGFKRLYHLRRKSYDYDALFSVLATLTDVTVETIAGYYQDLYNLGILEEIKGRIRSVPDFALATRKIDRIVCNYNY